MGVQSEQTQAIYRLFAPCSLGLEASERTLSGTPPVPMPCLMQPLYMDLLPADASQVQRKPSKSLVLTN